MYMYMPTVCKCIHVHDKGVWPTYLVEDVWYVLLRRGLFDVAEFWGIQGGDEAIVSYQRLTLIGYLHTQDIYVNSGWSYVLSGRSLRPGSF